MELVFSAYSAKWWVAEVMEDTEVRSDGREAYYSALGFRSCDHEAYPIVSQEQYASSNALPLAASLRRRSYG